MGLMRWSGGKVKEAKTLLTYFPSKEDIDLYYEPFLGAGSCLLEYQPYKFIGADINPHLIQVYKELRNDPNKFILDLLSLIKAYQGSSEREKFYHATRERLGSSGADFYFLLLFGFNGLCRYNSKGKFNTAWGRDRHNYDLTSLEDKLHKIASYISSSDCGFFEEAYQQSLVRYMLSPKSFVYLDPPYHKTHNMYDKSLLGAFNQEELYNYLENYPCKWLMTNSGTPYIRDLFKKYEIIDLPTRRSLNSKKNTPVTDVIIKNF